MHLVSFIKNQGIPPQYTEEVTTMTKSGTVTVAGVSGEIDDLFREAVKVVCQYDRASCVTSSKKTFNRICQSSKNY